MKNRIELDNKFREILNSTNVYFQPPESVKMQYPCIRYRVNDYGTGYADNLPYKIEKSFMGTIITKNADSDIIEKILKLPKCRFDRFYTADNLYHWVFIIYL